MRKLFRQFAVNVVVVLSMFFAAPAQAANPEFVNEMMKAIYVADVSLNPPSDKIKAILKKYGHEDITVYATTSNESPAFAANGYVAINEAYFPSDALLTYVILHEIGHYRLNHVYKVSAILADHAEVNNVFSVRAFIREGFASNLPSTFYEATRKAEYEADQYAFDELERLNELKIVYKDAVAFLINNDKDVEDNPKSTHPAGYKRAAVLTDRMLRNR